MPLQFSEEIFDSWNNTTSVVTLPAKIVGQDKPAVVRNDLILAIGAEYLEGCQVLPKLQVRIQFKSQRFRRAFHMGGISFWGVHLVPESDYETVQQVFVEAAPFQFSNEQFREALTPFGRVSQVKHLPVKGYPHIQSGTRMVSMNVRKSIPAFLSICGFRCKVWYRGQPVTCFACSEVGHIQSRCPKMKINSNRSHEAAVSQTETRPAVTTPVLAKDTPANNNVLAETPSLLNEVLTVGPAALTQAAGKNISNNKKIYQQLTPLTRFLQAALRPD